MKTRVLQLQSRYNVNSSDLAEQVIKSLPLDKYEVTSAYLKGVPEKGAMLTSAAHVKYFNFTSKKVKGLRLSALAELRAFCIANNFDVVIAHRFKPIHMIMLLNLQMKFKLCVGVAHGFGDYDRFYRKVECRFLIRDNWNMVAVSKPVKRYLVTANAGFSQQNTIHINNAIDIEKAVSGLKTKERAREKLSVPAEGFVFGTIGRLVPVKGQIHLLKAFRIVAESNPLAHLVIIGEGRVRGELEAYVTENDLAQQVHLVGAIENAFRYVKGFDVFVLPSLSEGLPLALLEAMAGSLPVIGSDIPTIRPIVESVGRIFSVGDSQALASNMREMMLLEESELKDLGRKHFEYVSRHHTIVDFRENYLQLIANKLESN